MEAKFSPWVVQEAAKKAVAYWKDKYETARRDDEEREKSNEESWKESWITQESKRLSGIWPFKKPVGREKAELRYRQTGSWQNPYSTKNRYGSYTNFYLYRNEYHDAVTLQQSLDIKGAEEIFLTEKEIRILKPVMEIK